MRAILRVAREPLRADGVVRGALAEARRGEAHGLDERGVEEIFRIRGDGLEGGVAAAPALRVYERLDDLLLVSSEELLAFARAVKQLRLRVVVPKANWAGGRLGERVVLAYRAEEHGAPCSLAEPQWRVDSDADNRRREAIGICRREGGKRGVSALRVPHEDDLVL
jgi:hypothetical protein